MAKDDKEQAQDEQAEGGAAGVAQGPEVVVVTDGGPSTGSAAAPNVNSGLDQGADAAKRAKLEREMRDLGMEVLDPVTNQPVSDFFPTVEGMDETSQDLILGNMRATGVDMRAERLQRTMRGREVAAREQELAEERRELVDKANPLPKQETIALDPATYRSRAHARVMAEAATLQSSTTIPGGRYLVNGQLVNANGDRIDKNGKIIEKRNLTA
jgi:hypothetical protein